MLKFDTFKIDVVDFFVSKIKEIENLAEKYKDIELKQTKGSNFVFDYDRGIINEIEHQIKNIGDNSLILRNSELLEKVRIGREHFYKIYEKTLNDMDEMFQKKQTSTAFWGNDIQKGINSFAKIIIDVLDIFQEKKQLVDIQEKIEKFMPTVQTCEKLTKEYSSKIEQGEKTISELENRLRLVINDKDILALNQFYSSRKEEKNKENKIYTVGYYSSFGLIILVIIYLLFDVTQKIFFFKEYTIITYMLIASIIGIISFMMIDFRKRMNISKSILDDIDQKNVIIESYSVLLEKKKNISGDNQQKYEIDLIKSIFGNLLSVKNFGYTKKEMQSMSTNIIAEILDKISDKIKL